MCKMLKINLYNLDFQHFTHKKVINLNEHVIFHICHIGVSEKGAD